MVLYCPVALEGLSHVSTAAKADQTRCDSIA